jgi:hypothetical protein
MLEINKKARMKIRAVVIQYPMKNHNSYIQFVFHDGFMLIKF